jgi:hypothetical protein
MYTVFVVPVVTIVLFYQVFHHPDYAGSPRDVLSAGRTSHLSTGRTFAAFAAGRPDAFGSNFFAAKYAFHQITPYNYELKMFSITMGATDTMPLIFGTSSNQLCPPGP